MLIYSPAFDISHCIFRMFYIINFLDENFFIEIDKIRIIDYYLAYPGCIKDFKFPKEMNDTKLKFKGINHKYRNPISNNETFKKISILQQKALMTILSQGYINIESFKKGYIKRTNKEIYFDLKINLLNFKFYGDQSLPQLLVQSLVNIELNGNKGLKARSGLMEYRYENS